MKAGELKASIRTMKGNPAIETHLPDGRTVWVLSMKSSLLAVLDSSFEHKGVETGLELDDGKIRAEVMPAATLSLNLDLDLPAPVYTLDLDI